MKANDKQKQAMREYYKTHRDEMLKKHSKYYRDNQDRWIAYAREARRDHGREIYARQRCIHPLRDIHSAMLERCGLRKCANKYILSAYAGRGITVCEEWRDLKTFEKWCLSHGWKRGLQIDRIDNDKGYSPDNCRFVTCKENCRNRRRNHIVEYKGARKTVIEFVESGSTALSYNATLSRLNRGWSVEDAFETGKVTNQYRKAVCCA